MSTTTATTTEPAILTANTYFWTPAQSAGARRKNETRRIGEVSDYLTALGFEVEQGFNSLRAVRGCVTVHFSYSESCKNVYKRFTVTRSGKPSNITAIRKIANEGKG